MFDILVDVRGTVGDLRVIKTVVDGAIR